MKGKSGDDEKVGRMWRCLGEESIEMERTSIWRSVALVKLSVTSERTRSSGRCVGCELVPRGGNWFLK